MNRDLRKDKRVVVTGVGRTSRWDPTIAGTITSVRKGAVFVHWDGTSFEDQMDPAEVRLVPELPASKTMGMVLSALEVYDVASVDDLAATTKCREPHVALIVERLLAAHRIVEVIPGKYRLASKHRTPKGKVVISHR